MTRVSEGSLTTNTSTEGCEFSLYKKSKIIKFNENKVNNGGNTDKA